MAKHDITKTPFSQKIIDGLFSENFVEDGKLMPETILKDSRQYLPPFLSYQENPEGADFDPPPLLPPPEFVIMTSKTPEIP